MIGDSGTLSRLNIVRTGAWITDEIVQSVENKMLKSFANIIKHVSINTLESPFLEDVRIDSIDAYFLLNILKESYGDNHILGITDMDLETRDDGDFYNVILGGKNPENHVAIVSTKRLAYEGTNLVTLLERTAKVSIHEVGHNLGLTDHDGYISATDGNLCPMSRGEFNKFGYKGYVKAIVDQRGFVFCDDCQNFLRHIYIN